MNFSLSEIKDPSFLKPLCDKELRLLADQIRARIIDVMSINGGHLASNLGSIELLIAFHKVFNSPTDKLLFDTSHQAYTHKILTGRDALFDSIRLFKGLSGFTCPEESEHDHFYAGHAGTALSLALGVARARDLSLENFHVAAVIGDAAFTCGLTLEALNHIDKNLSRFVVILNDNGMSISENVGTLTHLFKSSEAKRFFENFHFEYVGPINGHDMTCLLETFERAKNSQKPILIHAMTNKGHGMERARVDPVCYHGVKPFEKRTGDFQAPSLAPTFPKVFGEVMYDISHKHQHVVTLTPAMSVGSGLVKVMQTFPERCLDVGIAEGHCMTFAGGIAYDRTKKVVVSIYATFLQRALDNLFQDVCLQNAPVVVALDRAGLAGGDGATHNGIYDFGFLKGMPNLLIAQPRTGDLLQDLLFSSLGYSHPFVIRYPNLPTTFQKSLPRILPIGKGEILEQGEQILIIAVGHLCQTAFEISSLLKKEGLTPTILDPIFLKPFDEELFFSQISSHSMVITLEEHALYGGFGETISRFMVEQNLHKKVYHFGIKDHFIEHGSYRQLMKEIGLDAETIAKKILSCFSLNMTSL